ncbi:MFS transporter, partial [Pseudomonas sp. GW531-R1]|uniref:MFS transporter n=1 Tax=Pseudomonas sp. GW531-R1 TaxID=2075556 RepID=UPI000CD38412
MGIGLLIPILPNFIAQLSHQTLSEAARDYGWLLALYGAMQFLFSPLLGTLSDQFGRRPVLLVS